MQLVAAQRRGVEPGSERLDVLSRLRRLQCLFGKGETKKQDVRLHPVDEQRDDFLGASLVEQKVRVGREQELVVDRFKVRRAEMLLGLLHVTLSQSHLGKARQHPDLHFGLDVRRLGKRRGEGAMRRGGLARGAIEVGQAADSVEFGFERLQG